MAKTDSMASGLISSTPFDQLKQIDVNSPSAVANEVKASEQTSSAAAIDVEGIRPNKPIPKIDEAKEELTRNADRQLLKNSIKSSMSKAGVDLEEMPIPLNSSLISGLASAMCDGDESTVRAMFGNVDAINSLESLANGIYNLRDKFGKSQLDTGTLNSVLGPLIDMGLDKLDAKLLACISTKSPDPAFVRNKMLGKVKQLITDGKTESVVEIKEHIRAEQVLSSHPTLINDLLTTYKHPKGHTAKDWPTDLKALVAHLSDFDSNWSTYHRNGVAVTNLAAFTKLSKDANELFMSSDDYRPIVMFAKEYRPVRQLNIAKKQYPKTYLAS